MIDPGSARAESIGTGEIAENGAFELQDRRRKHHANIQEAVRSDLWIFERVLQRNGAPGEIRTPDLLLRRQSLYPAELRARSEPFQFTSLGRRQQSAANFPNFAVISQAYVGCASKVRIFAEPLPDRNTKKTTSDRVHRGRGHDHRQQHPARASGAPHSR